MYKKRGVTIINVSHIDSQKKCKTVCKCCRFVPTDSGIFGVPLTTLLENDQKKYPGSRVPLVFKKVCSSFLLWLLETRLECCDRDCECWLFFWKVPSQHFSGLRFSSLPHPWTEPRHAISHYPDPTAHARLRYRGFPKNKGGGQKCSGLFYVPALTSMPLLLSGMLEAVYCFTGERFTEETLRNTEMD